MKQYITVEQLNELSQEQRQKLRKWWNPVIGDLYASITSKGTYEPHGCYRVQYGTKSNEMSLPLLNIGQMIELIGEKWINTILTGRQDSWTGEPIVVKNYQSELCDALWETVKAVL